MRKGTRSAGSKGDKRSRPTRRSSSVQGPRLVLEWLEERILLSEDLLYSAVDNRALTLKSSGGLLEVVPTADPSTVLASRSISLVQSGVEITSAGFGVNLTIDTSVPQVSGGILFDGSGTSVLSGPGVDTTWEVTGAGKGWLGNSGYVRFQGVESLVGAGNNQDTFVFEPAGSLTGSIDGGVGGFDTLQVQGDGTQTVVSVPSGPNSGLIEVGAKRIAYDGLEPVLFQGVPNVIIHGQDTGGGQPDDVMTVDQADATHIRVSSSNGGMESQVILTTGLTSLTILGQGGNDSVELTTDLDLKGASLTIKAETILVDAGTSLTGVEDVNMTATADDATTASHASRTASIQVRGNITATGDVAIDASVVNVATDTTNTAVSTITRSVSSSATAEVSGSAVISGKSVGVHATTTVNVTAQASQSVSGTTSLTVTNVTRAYVTGTARLVVPTGAGGIEVSAVDDTTVTSTMTQPGTAALPVPFSFSALSSTATLSRDTEAYVDSTAAPKAIQTAGGVVIHAENKGSVQGTVGSNFVGSVTNTSQEDAIAYVSGAKVDGSGVEVSALSQTSFQATGKVAVNQVKGRNADTSLQGTRAFINGGVVTSGSGGIDVKATDSTEATAESSPLSITLDTLTTNVTVGVASARNELDRTTEAKVAGGADVEATGGNLTVEAKNQLRASAKADTTSVSASPTYLGTYQVGLGGILATNAILGGVLATVDGSTVKTIGSGDLKVDAQDQSGLDSTADLSVQATSSHVTLGSAGVSGGIAVAINTIGWKLSDPATIVTAVLDTLLNTNFWNAPAPYDVSARMTDSSPTAAGDLTVSADAGTQINATVSNAAVTMTSPLFGAAGVSASGILATNLIKSDATAKIESTGANGSVGAGGSVLVQAHDDRGVFSNSKVVSTSITTSDGGANVLNNLVSRETPHDFTTADGVQSLSFGSRVLLADDYANGGTPGVVYEYMGTSATGANRNLGEQDYTDFGFWKQVLETKLIPQGNNISSSDAIAVGGLVVRNDVEGDVTASITKENVTTTSGDVTVEALNALDDHGDGGQHGDGVGGKCVRDGFGDCRERHDCDEPDSWERQGVCLGKPDQDGRHHAGGPEPGWLCACESAEHVED